MKTLKWIGLMISVFGLTLAQCSTGNTDITKDNLVSECGGFEDQWNSYEDSDYCGAERLYWTYENGTLSLNNTRVLLNCCGDHSMSIIEESLGSYLVLETDAPENGTRCDCMCVFDFKVTAGNIPESTISIDLVRKVINDTTDKRSVLKTPLDLSEKSGLIVVSTEDVGPWCE